MKNSIVICGHRFTNDNINIKVATLSSTEKMKIHNSAKRTINIIRSQAHKQIYKAVLNETDYLS